MHCRRPVVAERAGRWATSTAPVPQVLLQSGGQGQASVLLLSDAQIKEEAFLEDVNNILNTGRRSQNH